MHAAVIFVILASMSKNISDYVTEKKYNFLTNSSENLP